MMTHAETGRDDAKVIAKAMLRTWAEDDLAHARTLVEPEGPMWLAHAAGAQGSEPNEGVRMSLRRWIELLQGVIDLMPGGLEVVVHHMISEDGWVAADVESRGALTDGRVYNMRYTFWFLVREGRIYEMKQFFDTKYGEQFFVNRHFEIPT